jgi:polyisoprenyl-phosphate glycosyltransferase
VTSKPTPSPLPELSVVLPVFDEEANLAELHRRLTQVLGGLQARYEIVFVDDGSRDASLGILEKLAATDPCVGVVALSRNFGHQLALTAGLDHARGAAVVLMDSDLQDPPEVIPELVARYREGYDVVYAQRRARPGESVFKRATAFLFYRAIRAIGNVDIPPDTGDFRLVSRRVADILGRVRERRRFLRGLVTWVGFRQGRVLYDRPPRVGGESKYDASQMVRLALRAFFSFSTAPITLIGLLGLGTIGAAAAVAAADHFLAGALLLVGGVQLVSLWILGQYIAVVSDEARRRPLYLVRERMNVQAAPASDE